MTFQPPPSPPGGTPPPPPPPPPGQWGPPPGSSGPGGNGSFDPKSVNPLDWGILAAGFLIFIFSFVDYYTFSQGGFSVSESAWHGFFGWFAMLCALIGSAAVAMSIFAPQVKLPMPNRLIGLGLYAVATLCAILALFVIPSYLGIDVPDSVDTGHGFGYWASLILIVAGLVLSLMRFQQTGGQLPGKMSKVPNIGGYGPQGGIPGGTGQGYGPPSQGEYGGQDGGQQPPAPGQYGGQQPPPGYSPPPPPPGYSPPPPGYSPPRQ